MPNAIKTDYRTKCASCITLGNPIVLHPTEMTNHIAYIYTHIERLCTLFEKNESNTRLCCLVVSFIFSRCCGNNATLYTYRRHTYLELLCSSLFRNHSSLALYCTRKKRRRLRKVCVQMSALAFPSGFFYDFRLTEWSNELFSLLFIYFSFVVFLLSFSNMHMCVDLDRDYKCMSKFGSFAICTHDRLN